MSYWESPALNFRRTLGPRVRVLVLTRAGGMFALTLDRPSYS